MKEDKQKNDIDVLVATDAISEGFNLHRAGTIFNYDIPALCSIIEFSSDYSSEVVICSKIILDEKGFNSPKIEQKFSSFKIKNNITIYFTNSTFFGITH